MIIAKYDHDGWFWYWTVDHYVVMIDDGVDSEDDKKYVDSEKEIINKGFQTEAATPRAS